MAADPSVTVSVCVMSGNISVRGWDKNEVMVRSSDAAQLELRRKDVSSQAQATKLEVFVADNDVPKVKENCQAFSDLELSVPRNAAVHAQTRDGNISIAGVGMAFAGTQNGDISVEKISRAIEVGSVGGSICVKDSTGRASVTTIGGGIDVANLRPTNAADVFEVISVSGDLMLEGIGHSLFNARTVTGNVQLSGPLARGGRYAFKTMSGDVTLALPTDASFTLAAKVSRDGEIITDFPLLLVPDQSPKAAVVMPAPAPAQDPAPRVKPPPQPDPPSQVSVVAPVSNAPKTATVVRVHPGIKKVIEVGPVVSAYSMHRLNAVCGTGDATINVASFSGTLRLQKTN